MAFQSPNPWFALVYRSKTKSGDRSQTQTTKEKKKEKQHKEINSEGKYPDSLNPSDHFPRSFSEDNRSGSHDQGDYLGSADGDSQAGIGKDSKKITKNEKR